MEMMALSPPPPSLARPRPVIASAWLSAASPHSAVSSVLRSDCPYHIIRPLIWPPPAASSPYTLVINISSISHSAAPILRPTLIARSMQRMLASKSVRSKHDNKKQAYPPNEHNQGNEKPTTPPSHHHHHHTSHPCNKSQSSFSSSSFLHPQSQQYSDNTQNHGFGEIGASYGKILELEEWQ